MSDAVSWALRNVGMIVGGLAFLWVVCVVAGLPMRDHTRE